MGDAQDAEEHHRRYWSSQKEALLRERDVIIARAGKFSWEWIRQKRGQTLQAPGPTCPTAGNRGCPWLCCELPGTRDSWSWRAETETAMGSEAGDVISRKHICKARMQKRERQLWGQFNSPLSILSLLIRNNKLPSLLKLVEFGVFLIYHLKDPHTMPGSTESFAEQNNKLHELKADPLRAVGPLAGVLRNYQPANPIFKY